MTVGGEGHLSIKRKNETDHNTLLIPIKVNDATNLPTEICGT